MNQRVKFFSLLKLKLLFNRNALIKLFVAVALIALVFDFGNEFRMENMQNGGVFIIQLVCGRNKKTDSCLEKKQSRKAIANSMNIQQTIVKDTKKYSLAKALKTFRIYKKNGTRIRDRQLHTCTHTHIRS